MYDPVCGHQSAHQCCHSCADPYESDFYFQNPGSQRSSAGLLRQLPSVVVSFAPAAILQCLFQSYFVTAGRPNLGLVLTMIAGILNAVLDYVFIVVCQMGISGAALATGIGQSIPAIAGLLFLHFRKVLCISPISDSISGNLDRPVIMVPLK